MFTYHRRSNLPVLQQIRLRQVVLTLTSDWIKLSGSYVTWTQFMQLRKEAWKKVRTSTGFFFQASLRNCINCVHCDDHFFIFISFPQFIYDLFHISLTCQILLQKVRLLSTFCCNLICCETGWNIGCKTRSIVFQLVVQQCCKTSCRCLFPVLPYLESDLVCACFFNRAACFFHFCSTEQSVCGCLEPENDSIWKTGRNRYISNKNIS